MPIRYHGIRSIINEWAKLPMPGRFYGKSRVTADNIRTIELTLLTSAEMDDYVNENDQIIPDQLAGQGYRSWLDSASVQAIIENALDADEAVSDDAIIDAIFFYLEMDTFMHE